MYLLLMRHAIAVKRDEIIEDGKRELTEKGKQRLIEVANGLKNLIHQDLVIHSSPLIRAFQSAEIIAGIIENTPIHLVDELASGDYKPFLSNLKNDPIQLAIGHEPYLSEWLFELTNVDKAFKKASFALIELSDKDAQLICYAKASDMINFNEKKGWYGKLHLLIHLFNELKTNVLDEVALHQYRTTLRAFDALIYAVKKQAGINIPLDLEKLILQLLDMTNTLRERDVLINEINNNSSLEPLRELLIQERLHLFSQFREDFHSIMKETSIELLLFGLIVQFDKTTKKRFWLQSRFNHLLKEVKKEIKHFDHHSIESLHNLRLSMKKIIYIGDYHAKYFSEKTIKLVELAKEIKDYSGTYLDFQNNLAFFDELTIKHPDWKSALDDFKDQLDAKTPSTFTIHQMLFKLSKRIGG